jgi:superfamily II DNA/RNA helicase
MRAVCIHGRMPASERHHIVAGFNRGASDLLIATDAAGEGLNLHHRCRLVVDLELPWNPLRLEQRIGRVDRLGQRRRVHGIRLFHARGIEARVLHHLQLRQRRADLDVMPASRADADLARAIFDDSPLPPVPRIRGIAVTGGREEAVRLAHARAARACSLDDGAWARPRRNRTSMAAVRRVTSTNAHGSLVEERVEAWRVELSPGPARREWPRVVGGIAKKLPRPEPCDGASYAQVSARIEAIRSGLARGRANAVQRSLFDRRAEEHARREEHAVRRADAALQRCLAAVAPADRDGAAQATLVAAWPLRRP